MAANEVPGTFSLSLVSPLAMADGTVKKGLQKATSSSWNAD